MSGSSEVPAALPSTAGAGGLLVGIAPGVPALLNYRFAEDFRLDLVAGISVAAVALPVAVAYAQLAGFNPVVGLYSSILPLVAYAIFGTSRQQTRMRRLAPCSPPPSRRSPPATQIYICRFVSR
jgi:hypothetical protein